MRLRNRSTKSFHDPGSLSRHRRSRSRSTGDRATRDPRADVRVSVFTLAGGAGLLNRAAGGAGVGTTGPAGTTGTAGRIRLPPSPGRGRIRGVPAIGVAAMTVPL